MGTKEIITCDGCGAKSGENGCYPANKWIKIVFADGMETHANLDHYLNISWTERHRQLFICRKCLGLPEKEWLSENAYAKGLKKLFKKHRKVTPYEMKLLEEVEKLKQIIVDKQLVVK